jgi:hypothetical protein
MCSHGQPTRGSPTAWELNEGLKTPHSKKFNILRVVHKSLGLVQIFWKDANVKEITVYT